LLAALALSYRYSKFGDRSDFSQALFGARALLNGADPYALVGPGRVYDSHWPVMYPATTYVAAIPFTPLSDGYAAEIFIGVSVFLLVYGLTADTWHRLPMLASVAFTHSVQLAQWSPLMTAILFMPLLGMFAALKPQASIPIIAVSQLRKSITAAAIGGISLFAISLAMFPSWPAEWLRVVRSGEQFAPPILRLGGFLILLALTRWRRPEAWLILLMALMPQTWGWYNVLPLLAIASTYREACVLSLVSSFGALMTAWYITDADSGAGRSAWGAAQVAFAYLPAVIAVLRRPNVTERAPWLPKNHGQTVPIADSIS
jgi:hypothetical protein